ncbi:MAG: efflux RND transporter periplasmic adaptor subunit [Pseudomonadota bacterium]
MTRKTPLTHWIGAGIFGLLVLAGGASAVMALQARAADEPRAQERAALTVAVSRIEIQARYQVRESYVGQVEPARLTTPSFERSGKVTDLLVDEGDEVDAGQVLARMDTRALEIERMRLEAERASLVADTDLAQRTVERREQLVDDGWASRQAFDEAQFSLTALAARRDSITAAIARIDLDLEKSVLLAPFSGTVSARQIDEGTVVASGTPVLSLQETTRPQARIGIPSDRADLVSRGDRFPLLYRGRAIIGEVAAITRDLQFGTRSIPILLDLDADFPLTMGQVIRLDLTRNIEVRGAWVPLAALREAERGLWSIQTARPTDTGYKVAREAVEVLHVADQNAYVRGTFQDGALLIPEGGHRLSVGQDVTPAGDV